MSHFPIKSFLGLFFLHHGWTSLYFCQTPWGLFYISCEIKSDVLEISLCATLLLPSKKCKKEKPGLIRKYILINLKPGRGGWGWWRVYKHEIGSCGFAFVTKVLWLRLKVKRPHVVIKVTVDFFPVWNHTIIF